MIADLLGLSCGPALEVACDNDGAAANAHQESVNRRDKHIHIAYHFAGDASKQSVAYYKACVSQEKAANTLTNPLGRVLFQKFVAAMRLHKDYHC